MPAVSWYNITNVVALLRRRIFQLLYTSFFLLNEAFFGTIKSINFSCSSENLEHLSMKYVIVSSLFSGIHGEKVLSIWGISACNYVRYYAVIFINKPKSGIIKIGMDFVLFDHVAFSSVGWSCESYRSGLVPATRDLSVEKKYPHNSLWEPQYHFSLYASIW